MFTPNGNVPPHSSAGRGSVEPVRLSGPMHGGGKLPNAFVWLGPVTKGSGTSAQVESGGVVPVERYVPVISSREPLRNSSHVRCVKLSGVC